MYLWRAVDSEGEVLDILIQKLALQASRFSILKASTPSNWILLLAERAHDLVSQRSGQERDDRAGVGLDEDIGWHAWHHL